MGDHVFICYAREDEEFVLKLAKNLKDKGVPVWLDQWNIPPGANWNRTIDVALYDCGKFLIVLSQAAIDSHEVEGEWLIALEENKPIFPVLYQRCRVPRQLKPYNHVDFTSRGPDDSAALERVLSVLNVKDISSAQPSETAIEPPPPEPERTLPNRYIESKAPFELEMILIPAGKFLMGSDPNKYYVGYGEQHPQHSLDLPDYYLAETPVTNAQYAGFVESTGHEAPEHFTPKSRRSRKGKENHPVVNVSWHDAIAYCKWLSDVTGKNYRLPSEAEWEKGARGTDGHIYPWGDEPDPEKANYSKTGIRDTTEVGCFPEGASPYGLLGMAGNVCEWTRSLWGGDMDKPEFKYPYDPEDGREDLEAGDEVFRVLRGGSFFYDVRYMRCADRYRYNPLYGYRDVGFRAVLSPS